MTAWGFGLHPGALIKDASLWPDVRHGSEVELDAEQLQALVLGLPWQRVGSGGAITVLYLVCHGALTSAIGPSVYRRHCPSLAKSAA